MKGYKTILSSLIILLLQYKLNYILADEDIDHYGSGGDPYGLDGYGDPYGEGEGGGYGSPGGYGDYSGNDGGPTITPPKELNSIKEINDYISEDEQETTIIGYFDLQTNNEDKKIFEEAHRIGQYKYRFGYTTNKDILNEMKYSGFSLVVYRPAKFVSDKYEKVKSRYPGKSLKSSTTLLKWIEEKALPLVGLKKLGTAGKYDDLTYPQLTLFTDVDLERNIKQFQYYANRLRKVAKDYVSKMSFNIADKTEFSALIEKFGFETTDKKHAHVGITFDKKYYLLEKDFTTENVKEFVELYFAGSLVGKVYEEETEHQDEEEEEDPYSESGDSDGTKHVVAVDPSNYDSLITNTNKDVMIEFYAPWCGHCKQLAPTYEQVAKDLSVHDSVLIAKFDASTHTAPKQFDVQGFPTLFFVPGDRSKSPISYEGGRDKKSIINFIKKHATTSLK